MNEPKCVRWIDVEFVFADGSKGPGKAAAVGNSMCDCIADLGEITTRFWANADGTSNPPHTNVRLAKPFDEYESLDRLFDSICRMVLVGACANEPKSAKHLRRPIEIVVRSFFPEKAIGTKVDVGSLLDSLVSEGKLERAWSARFEGDKRTADNAVFAIPTPRRQSKKSNRKVGP